MRRIEQITKVMDELAQVGAGNALLMTLWQLDWLDELHRLLYGGDL